MRKIEQLNKLQAEMKEARITVEQLCADWGWTLSDKEATMVTNEIVINKGKVTAIEITKEDNSTIEMLRETIRQMNQNMNDMQKQHEEEITKLKEQYEQQMLDMTSEFEYEVECIVNKREKQIKELEEKLDFKELLLSEFRDNMDEKIETIHKLEDENESLNDTMEGMKFGYEDRIKRLQKQLAKEKQRPTIEVVDDPEFNEQKEEKKVETPIRHKNVDMVLYDVHVTHDGTVRGYTKDYEFAWNGKSNVPAYKTKAMKKWHPMVRDMYAEALYIKEQVKDMFKNTKEEVVDDVQEIIVPVQKPKTTTHVTNGATIVLPNVEHDCGDTDDIDFF